MINEVIFEGKVEFQSLNRSSDGSAELLESIRKGDSNKP